jgi:DNA-binding transcriptional regulator YhcF (GntR family)
MPRGVVPTRLEPIVNYGLGGVTSPPKYVQVAATVRAQIADGRLLPGASAPSGAALARATGFAVLTCRRGLELLVREGVLVPGPSRNARPRVPGPTHDEQALAEAERVLSMTLAARRRAAGITQPELAALAGVSITTIGHAETGRLWQSRHFWERVDKALDADGLLLRLHDDYRAAAVPTRSAAEHAEGSTVVDPAPDPRPQPATVTCITITWGNGTTTTVHPPTGTGACHVDISEIHGTSRDGTSRP